MTFTPLRKLALVAALFTLNLVGIRLTAGTEAVGYLVFTLCVVLFPILVLSMVDALRSIRRERSASKPTKALAVLLALPSLLMGLVALSIGVSIVLWVLYNVFIHREPEYTGPTLVYSLGSFGIGVPLIALGVRWVALAFGARGA